MGMFHYYDLSYSEVFIFDNYLINQIREGEEINANHNYILTDLVQKHFDGKNIVYVSNRVKSYSVDPLVYKKVEKISNLLAIVIISNTEVSRKSAEYEKKFYDKPFKICNNLTEAIMWVNKIIDTKGKKK